LVHAFRAGRLSLVSLTTRPRLSAPSPTSSRPSSPAPPPIPGHRAPPSSAPRVPPSCYHLAFISPPLISLLNPPRRSPEPYKRPAPPPEFTAPLPASLRISPRSSLPLTECQHHRAFTIVARPPRRCSSPGEALDELPVRSSLCCAPAGKLWRTGAAGGRVPMSAPPCPGPPLSAPPSVHGGPSAAGRSTETWTRSTDLYVQK
jgi:hypothetical protein